MTDPTVDPPLVSVCVVLYRTEPELVEACLDSIREASHVLGRRIEIVVADNSPDELLRARFDTDVDVWLWNGHNVGFGAAANWCMRSCSGQFVLFLNPDATLEPSALGSLVAAVDHVPDGALLCGWLMRGGRVQVDGFMHWWSSGERFVRRRRYMRYLEASARAEVVPVQKACGGALFASADALSDLGGFDERFFLYGED